MLYYNALCYYVLIIPKLSQVYSINTDRFYITNLKRTIRKKSDVKFEVKHVGRPFITNSKPTYFEKHYRKNLDYKSYLRICSCLACVYRVMDARGKFGAVL